MRVEAWFDDDRWIVSLVGVEMPEASVILTITGTVIGDTSSPAITDPVTIFTIDE